MTGYGRCQDTVAGKDIIVEIKSVNHRYFEFSARVTRGYGFIEDRLKNFVQALVSRGKIDVFVSIQSVEDCAVVGELNRSLTDGYIKALRTLSEDYGLPDDIHTEGILADPVQV